MTDAPREWTVVGKLIRAGHGELVAHVEYPADIPLAAVWRQWPVTITVSDPSPTTQIEEAK